MEHGTPSLRLAWELAAGFEFLEDLLGDFFQSFENAHALKGNRLDDGLVLLAKFGGQHVDRQDVRQISFVQLQNVGNLVEVVAVLFQVGHQVLERFDVGVHALFLRIGDENNPIHAAQDELAAGVVEDLSGNGVEVDAGLEAAHRAKIEGQEVEEQRALGLGGERDHLAFLLICSLLIDHLQIRGLAAQSGAVIHDFTIDLAGCEVDETQGFPQMRAALRAASQQNTPVRGLGVFISHAGYLRQVTQVTPAGFEQLASSGNRVIAVFGVNLEVLAIDQDFDAAVGRAALRGFGTVTERVLVASVGGDFVIRIFNRVARQSGKDASASGGIGVFRQDVGISLPEHVMDLLHLLVHRQSSLTNDHGLHLDAVGLKNFEHLAETGLTAALPAIADHQ